MSILGVLMTSPIPRTVRRAEKVVSITVATLAKHEYVCKERLSECEAAHGDWICGACKRGFITALEGYQCSVCQAIVVAVAFTRS